MTENPSDNAAHEGAGEGAGDTGEIAPTVLDVRGLNCPLPVLKARKALSAMPSGARLLVETTDPLAAIDIPAFCNEAGHQLVASKASGDHVGYLIQKG